MKHLLPLLVISVLLTSACASRSKNTEAAKPGAPSGENMVLDDETPDNAKATKSKELIADAAASRSLDPKYQPLGAAVRAAKADLIIQEAAKILSANPNDAVALNTLGLYYFRRGKISAARLLIEKALEKNQDNPALHNNLGVLLMSDNEPQLALESFKKALKLNDKHPAALGNLGSIYLAGGDYLKAQPLLEQAYSYNRNDALIANNFAITLRASKNFDKAERIYGDLIKQNSRDVDALINYATLLIDYMNKPKDGLAIVYKVKFLETDRKEIVQRANALEKKAKSELK